MTTNTPGRISGTIDGTPFDLPLPAAFKVDAKLKRPLTEADVPQMAGALAASYREGWLAHVKVPGSRPAGKRIERDPDGHIIRLLDEAAFDGPAAEQKLGDHVEQIMRAVFDQALRRYLRSAAGH
jgi:hypothetical protein